jgi:hypothetical protein
VYYALPEVSFFDTIEQFVRKYVELGSVLIMGDLNARCGEANDFLNVTDFEKYINVISNGDSCEHSFNLPNRFTMDQTVNTSGKKLLELCHSSPIKIVNGRLGDDAGIGSFTFVSDKGCSLIDYALCSYNLFSIIQDFIVHDFQTCSTHAPIEIKFSVDKYCNEQYEHVYMSNEKLVWNDEKISDFKNELTSNIDNLVEYVNNITTNTVDVNVGIDILSKSLYDIAFKVFGKNKSYRKSYNRKYKSPWYNNSCERARREFCSANRLYYKNKTLTNRHIMINCKKRYKQEKKKAFNIYNNNEKIKFHDLARNDPQRFWKEIKKFKNKNPNRTNISTNEFYEYFKELFSDSEVFANNEVENGLSGIINDISIEQLDSDFNLDEVKKAIKHLKKEKSAGVDRLISEIFIEGIDILAPILCTLFNYLFTYSIYPESWALGTIVPVPKKGDTNDINNYRGITVTSVFSKIFSIILDERLKKWAENNNLLSDFQFGFRSQRS